MVSTEEKLRRHKAFWAAEKGNKPLVIVRIGDLFLSRRFEAMLPLLERGHEITPEQIVVEDFLPDYERMYLEANSVNQDGFFAAEPCTGLPWMEAIFGARVVGESVSVITRPVVGELSNIKGIEDKGKNQWYQKYLEFSAKLTAFAKGRFPVCQPILRGVTDTVGALIGQSEMAYALVDEPEKVKAAFFQIAEALRMLIRDQYKTTISFFGGRSIGFYHIWAPGSVIWYQEDLASLMSPAHYQEYLYQTSCRIVEDYEYSLVHLHPASFLHLDGILQVANLKAVQLNKDLTGPSVEEMLPQCKAVLEGGKNLVLGMGLFTKKDIDVIYEELPHERTALNILADSVEEANEIIGYIDSKDW